MDLKQNNCATLKKWFCPVYGHEIDESLCWEISNIGNNSLKLSEKETPPCGWDDAHRMCDKCPHDSDWN